jgi:hypothetical protein
MPYQRPSTKGVRQGARTPAERAAEFASVQRRLKQEAAERRKSAPNTGKRRTGGRRTP